MEDTPIARQLKPGDRAYRGRSVRLISETNEQIGIVTFEEALRRAQDIGLDLVEMNTKSEPPVCRILDFGKWQYQEDKRQKEAKKNQIQQKIKEMKFHLHIDDNDFNTKIKHSLEFLQRGDKVKVLLAYRGREMAHQDQGQVLLDKIVQAIGEIGIIDSPAKLLGRNCQMVIAPNMKLIKKKSADNAKEAAKDSAKKEP